MNLYCIKCLKFTNSDNVEIKHEVDGKINLHSYCFECGFENVENIDREELIY